MEPEIRNNGNGTFTVKALIQCESCRGTGLYVGMGERDGAAIQCHRCKGKGSYVYERIFTHFTGRKPHKDKIERVYLTNPGYGIGKHGKDKTFRLEEFGGISFGDWLAGKGFPLGSEMRRNTCPAWWTQSAGCKWESKKCLGVGAFSSCKHYPDRDTCWAEYDKEKLNENPNWIYK